MWTLIDECGTRAIEGPAGAPWLADVRDAARVIEACLSSDIDAALLYAPNLTPAFFDLSSREAGEILQKLRNYRIRLAVACPSGTVAFSSRFGDMLAEERRGRFFGVFDTRGEALEWLAGRPLTDPDCLRAEAVALATEVLEGRASAIVAARRMLVVLGRLLPRDDSAFECFVLVDSDTDALPVGIVRAEWDREALRGKEPDVARAEARAMEISEETLRGLVRRWRPQT